MLAVVAFAPVAGPPPVVLVSLELLLAVELERELWVVGLDRLDNRVTEGLSEAERW